MSQRVSIERAIAIAGTLPLVGSTLAWLLSITTQPDETAANFYLFAAKESWFETMCLFGVLCAFWWRTTLWSGAMTLNTWFEKQSSDLVVRVLLLGVIALLALRLGTDVGDVVRARHYFWTRLAAAAHSQQMVTNVEVLARSGRTRDALAAAEVSLPAVRSEYQRSRVLRRVARLKGLVERSNSLMPPDHWSHWNPVSDRPMYFELLEALRVDPQNYAAADKLREVVPNLVKDIHEDVNTICGSSGALGNFRGRSTTYLEAKIHWMTVGGTSACRTLEDQLRAAWAVSAAWQVLSRSDTTRRPLSADEWSALDVSRRAESYEPPAGESP
jgi:hypothetical protein